MLHIATRYIILAINTLESEYIIIINDNISIFKRKIENGGIFMEKRNRKNKERGNGEGTIYFSEALNCYVAQYVEPSGKRKTLKQRKNEKNSDFKKRFNDVISKINNGSYIEKSNDTFIDILEKHVMQKYNDGITSDSGYLRDLATIRLIKKTCGNFIDMPIQKIKADHIEKAKINMRNYAQTSIDKAWRLINKTFKLSISRRRIIFNPMDDESLVKPISKKQTKIVEALTLKEENALRKILNSTEKNHKYRKIILLQLNTGMRIGEVLARSKNDVDLKNNTLFIHNTLTSDIKGNVVLGTHTKTYNKKTNIDKGKRTLILDAESYMLLAEQLNTKITNIFNLLFWDYENNTFINYHEINAWLKRLNEKYKITNNNLSSHVLRHTKVTRMREAGIDMKVIQYLVGHVEGSSITDDIYTSLSDDFIKKELKKL